MLKSARLSSCRRSARGTGLRCDSRSRGSGLLLCLQSGVFVARRGGGRGVRLSLPGCVADGASALIRCRLLYVLPPFPRFLSGHHRHCGGAASTCSTATFGCVVNPFSPLGVRWWTARRHGSRSTLRTRSSRRISPAGRVPGLVGQPCGSHVLPRVGHPGLRGAGWAAGSRRVVLVARPVGPPSIVPDALAW